MTIKRQDWFYDMLISGDFEAAKTLATLQGVIPERPSKFWVKDNLSAIIIFGSENGIDKNHWPFIKAFISNLMDEKQMKAWAEAPAFYVFANQSKSPEIKEWLESSQKGIALKALEYLANENCPIIKDKNKAFSDFLDEMPEEDLNRALFHLISADENVAVTEFVKKRNIKLKDAVHDDVCVMELLIDRVDVLGTHIETFMKDLCLSNGRVCPSGFDTKVMNAAISSGKPWLIDMVEPYLNKDLKMSLQSIGDGFDMVINRESYRDGFFPQIIRMANKIVALKGAGGVVWDDAESQEHSGHFKASILIADLIKKGKFSSWNEERLIPQISYFLNVLKCDSLYGQIKVQRGGKKMDIFDPLFPLVKNGDLSPSNGAILVKALADFSGLSPVYCWEGAKDDLSFMDRLLEASNLPNEREIYKKRLSEFRSHIEGVFMDEDCSTSGAKKSRPRL